MPSAVVLLNNSFVWRTAPGVCLLVRLRARWICEV